MSRILLVYSTTDGHTRRISERIRQVVEQAGHALTLRSVTEPAPADLELFDKIVLGASIRYGKHAPAVYDFVARHHDVLVSRPNAFFSVNVVARKPEKRAPESNPYLQKFLARIRWRPDQLAVFAGKIDYPKYRYIDRQLIRLIMLMTKGPTDPTTVIEYTNWDDVEAFARALVAGGGGNGQPGSAAGQ